VIVNIVLGAINTIIARQKINSLLSELLWWYDPVNEPWSRYTQPFVSSLKKRTFNKRYLLPNVQWLCWRSPLSKYLFFWSLFYYFILFVFRERKMQDAICIPLGYSMGRFVRLKAHRKMMSYYHIWKRTWLHKLVSPVKSALKKIDPGSIFRIRVPPCAHPLPFKNVVLFLLSPGFIFPACLLYPSKITKWAHLDLVLLTVSDHFVIRSWFSP
jgi:hypothetical protein